MEKIKLIWDFFGDEAKKTAEHHAVHLNEYATNNSIQNFGIGVDQFSEIQYSAYIVVFKSDMIKVRDSLRPKRGQKVND